MSVFSSVIGPFGGFFASGFKRAFKIKVSFNWNESVVVLNLLSCSPPLIQNPGNSSLSRKCSFCVVKCFMKEIISNLLIICLNEHGAQFYTECITSGLQKGMLKKYIRYKRWIIFTFALNKQL